MPSIPDTLRTTAARCPDREALVFGATRCSYRELHLQVERTAAALAACGISRGDRVLLMSPNSDAFVIAAYAALRAGAILVPANPRNAPPEVAHLVTDSGASAVLYAPEVEAVVGPGVAQSGMSPLLISLPELAGLAAAEHPAVAHIPAESDDALLLYTSGTTGAPKGALFDHHRALWVATNITGTAGYRDGDRTMHVAPLYHAAQLTLVLFAGTALAMTHVVVPRFEPAEVADLIEAERISVFFGVPTMYQFLLRLPDFADRDFSAWRVGMFGAAPMPAELRSARSPRRCRESRSSSCAGRPRPDRAASTRAPRTSWPARTPAAGTPYPTPKPASCPPTVPMSRRVRWASWSCAARPS